MISVCFVLFLCNRHAQLVYLVWQVFYKILRIPKSCSGHEVLLCKISSFKNNYIERRMDNVMKNRYAFVQFRIKHSDLEMVSFLTILFLF